MARYVVNERCSVRVDGEFVGAGTEIEGDFDHYEDRRWVTKVSEDPLPIEDYDELSARAIVRAIDGLSDEDVATVLKHEKKNKGRKSIIKACEKRTIKQGG